MKRKNTDPKFVNSFLILMASLSLCAGLILLFASPTFLDMIIKQSTSLEPDSWSYRAWQRNGLPIEFNVFVFNWTNPEDLYQVNDKPSMVELGPYKFEQLIEKVNLTWNDNDTVSYYLRNVWYFDQDGSKGSLEDVISAPNFVPLAVSYDTPNWNFISRVSFSYTLNAKNVTYVTQRSVKDLLFGYHDDVADSTILANTLFEANFHWMPSENATIVPDNFNMGTGKGDTYLGELFSWKYHEEPGYFIGDCQSVHSSQGDVFPPRRDKKTLDFFQYDLCRPLTLNFMTETTVDGIPGYKYIVDKNVLDNGEKIYRNQCFCVKKCPRYGIIDMRSCRNGMPIFMSLPHFNKADAYFAKSINGLEPDEDKHEYYVTVEPVTGFPLEIVKRVQLNFLMKPYPTISVYQDLPEVYFPVMWYEQKMRAPPEVMEKLKFISVTSPKLFKMGAIALIILGIICLVLYIYRLIKDCKEERSRPQFVRELMPLSENEIKILDSLEKD